MEEESKDGGQKMAQAAALKALEKTAKKEKKKEKAADDSDDDLRGEKLKKLRTAANFDQAAQNFARS